MRIVPPHGPAAWGLASPLRGRGMGAGRGRPLVNHLQHLFMNAAIGGQNPLTGEAVRPVGEVSDPAAGLPHNQYARCHVPGLETDLPEAIEPSACDIGKIKHGRPSTPWLRRRK
jgi:hypothetical protein